MAIDIDVNKPLIFTKNYFSYELSRRAHSEKK